MTEQMYRALKPILVVLVFSLFNCGGSNLNSKFNLDRRFWTPEDYDNAIMEIRYRTPEGQSFPAFADPETSVVIRKLVDHENYRVVLNDSELGINHKNEVAQEFFDEYRELATTYSKMDRRDKYIYDEELVEILKFGLGLQVLYFKIGNDNIIDSADDPNDSEVIRITKKNQQTVIGNFNNYLDSVNEEDSFSGSAIELYIDGIHKHFDDLKRTFPNANYNGMVRKAELMMKKAKNDKLKKALGSLIDNLSSSAEG